MAQDGCTGFSPWADLPVYKKEEGLGHGRCVNWPLRKFLGDAVHHFCLDLISQILGSWPHLMAKEPEKQSTPHIFSLGSRGLR